MLWSSSCTNRRPSSTSAMQPTAWAKVRLNGLSRMFQLHSSRSGAEIQKSLWLRALQTGDSPRTFLQPTTSRATSWRGLLRGRSGGVNSQMRANLSESKLAPPTSAPSTSGISISASMSSGVTEPPYWMRTPRARSVSYISASTVRMRACASCACSGVAVLPVPIAQMGSYAIIIRPIAFTGTFISPFLSCSAQTAGRRPCSYSASVSPTQSTTSNPAASAMRTFLLICSSRSSKSDRRSE
mmetsp:Transcript_14984/g.38019  ORF Transcript_14984/g.38019 Transcript_14984/m.38019 type:complete len:241 (-) Transcript_14984:504-1226(-)